MRKMKFVLLVLALCACLVVTISADDGNYGEDIEFGTPGETTVEPETESSTEEQTTEPVTSETGEQTTEPETSETEDQTTEPVTSESEEVATEPDTSESEEVTTEPDGSVTEDQTTEPAASGTDAPATTSPAESETSGDQEKPWMLPIPVIFITIGVVGIGGIVLLVILLRMYFRAQQEDEKK